MRFGSGSKPWLWPVLALLVCVLWTLLVGPWVTELRADFLFLRFARQQAIAQAQQAQQKPQPAEAK